jgi:hypothetical protein
VLAAIAVRLLAGMLAPAGNVWSLPRPSLSATLAWFGRRRGRNPFFAWFAIALLGMVGLAAGTGAIADAVTWMEDLHEGIAETSLWVILGHIAFVTTIYNGRRLFAWVSQRLAGWRLRKETAQ